MTFLFFKYGREHRTQFRGRYFRELPDPELAPALVGTLMHWGTVKDSDAVATLLDLANRGVIAIAPVDEEKRGLLRHEDRADLQRSPSLSPTRRDCGRSNESSSTSSSGT